MPDPATIMAVNAAIQRFIGIVNYLSKFLLVLSEVCEPLLPLILQEFARHWEAVQKQAFEMAKKLITEARVLGYYVPTEELILQCDSSDKGLGAVLTQNGKPVAFASRALSHAETWYSQIEVVYGLERFHQYTYARWVTIPSDHKPLELIKKKPLLSAPKRLQRMLLRDETVVVKL